MRHIGKGMWKIFVSQNDYYSKQKGEGGKEKHSKEINMKMEKIYISHKIHPHDFKWERSGKIY